MSFNAPGRLWLLVAVVALIGAYVFLQRRRRHYAVRFTNVAVLASVAPRRPGWRRHLPATAMILAIAVMVLGFAQPTRRMKVPRDTATVMLAIDVSDSMKATDVKPDRITVAQNAAKEFVQKLPASSSSASSPSPRPPTCSCHRPPTAIPRCATSTT